MPMQPSAVQLIVEEHTALATVIDALRQCVDQVNDGNFTKVQ